MADHRDGVFNRRSVLLTTGAVVATSVAGRAAAADTNTEFDVIVIGGGTAGMPAATFAAQRGARVLIIEAAAELGGTLFLSGARMSAAGTKLQKQMGIDDNPDLHFDYVMQMSKNKANPEIVRLAVDHSAPVFDWLWENGLPIVEGTPTARGSAHEGQNRARYVWAPGAGMDVLEVLDKMITPHIHSGQITVQTRTEVTGLRQDVDGTISHVVAKTEDGNEVAYRGRHVVLASGGYTSNSKMFEELEGAPDYADHTYPYSQGIGITLGLAVGGFVRGGEHHLPSFGAIMLTDDIPSPILAGLNINPLDPKPWEIWVNAGGERFVNEDSHDIHEKELAVAKQSHERFWAVFDDQTLQSAPSLVRGWSREEVASAFDVETMFAKAGTIEQLAEKTGMPPQTLRRTVEQYNAGQRNGRDAYGREHMPMAIEKGPFYSIRFQSAQLISFAGLGVDGRLRVLRKNMEPIANLYAAGEVLGLGQLMGQNYTGGMGVTPALAFGRLLGHELIEL